MKFVLLLAFLFMWLANPITGGKLFPGFDNPEKWMKRTIRKLERKTSAYGNKIASNTAKISNTAGFISSIDKCESNYINDPDNGLSCCFEDNLNKGQCLCNGMTIDDTSNPGSCCMANEEHPDHCLCSGTDMDDATNPGNCCFANSGQCLCTGNHTDVPSKRCFNLDWKGDGICDDQNNHGGCNFDGGDCCGENVDTDLCTQCQCLEEEAPLPHAVGCCYQNPNNTGECLCTGKYIDDPDNTGSCCVEDPENPGTCCADSITCNGQGTCSSGSSEMCACNSGFTGDRCNVTTCPGVPVCSDSGSCPQGGTVCNCQAGFHGDDCAIFCLATTTCSGNGTCGLNGICQCDAGLTGSDCTEELSSLILVVQGNARDYVQLIDVDGTATCDLKAAPGHALNSPYGGLLENTPVICGGDDTPIPRKCHYHDKASNTWNLFANLVTGRRYAGHAIFKGALWVTGGSGLENNLGSTYIPLDSTEIIALDGTVSSGPNLPNGRQGHCMVALSNDEFMILGGSQPDEYRNTMTYNANSGTFTNGPSMLYDRRYTSSSMFQSKFHNDRRVLLIAGGAYGDTGTAELLDFTQENAQWVEVASLPITFNNLNGARTMTSMTGDGVYLRTDEYLFLFTCDESSCQWTTVKEGLEGAVAGIMMPLPSDYTCE